LAATAPTAIGIEASAIAAIMLVAVFMVEPVPKKAELHDFFPHDFMHI
jgi:hypothetical protein